MSFRDLTCLGSGIFISDFSGSESRFCLHHLGIRGIVTIASHAIDSLWADDGIQYHTVIISPAAPIEDHLHDICDFAARNQPCLICCSSGRGLSALACAAHAVREGREPNSSTALDSIREAVDGALFISVDDQAALDGFCDASMSPVGPSARSGPRVEQQEVYPSTPLKRKRHQTGDATAAKTKAKADAGGAGLPTSDFVL